MPRTRAPLRLVPASSLTPEGMQGGPVLLALHQPAEPAPSRWAQAAGLAYLEAPSTPAWSIAMVSARWGSHFRWRGRSLPNATDQAKLRRLVQQADSLGVRLRFYGKPDRPRAWQVQQAAGLHILHTNRTLAARRWLLRYQAGECPPLPIFKE